MNDRPNCRHSKLTFGDGGFLIHCAACGGTWAAIRGLRREYDHAASRAELTGNDVRVDPQNEVRG